MTEGTLPEESFRFYMIPDSHSLKDFARGLAQLAAKADFMIPSACFATTLPKPLPRSVPCTKVFTATGG